MRGFRALEVVEDNVKGRPATGTRRFNERRVNWIAKGSAFFLGFGSWQRLQVEIGEMEAYEQWSRRAKHD